MYLEVYAVPQSSFYKSQWNFDEAQYYGWSNVAKFNEIILYIQRNNDFDSTNYLYI